MDYKIAVIEGDGIGPEVVGEALNVLEAIAKKYNHKFSLTKVMAGGCAIDAFGTALPDETLNVCKASDAVILGAVGGYKWDVPGAKVRPEQGLLALRAGLGLFANLRPAALFAPLKEASPLKESITANGMDLMVVRELTGGIYFGERGRKNSGEDQEAYDVERYSYKEIHRIAKVAFELALKRSKKLVSVDKANVLESSRLWREIVNAMAKDYPEVTVEHMYVDNAAMQMVRRPDQFDVLLTNNIFGDILSDEASMVTGSIGMLPSASLGENNFGMYEPIHGSAPDIAGKDIANPLATILSVAMMLKYTFGLLKEGDEIESAVLAILEEGYRTGDIMSEGKKLVGTKKMGELVTAKITVA